MIKVETAKFPKEKILAFAFEGSNEKDLPVLDLLCASLSHRPGLKPFFKDTRRLIVHITDLGESNPEVFEELSPSDKVPVKK